MPHNGSSVATRHRIIISDPPHDTQSPQTHKAVFGQGSLIAVFP